MVRVVIVGAGLAGLCMASELGKAGLDPTELAVYDPSLDNPTTPPVGVLHPLKGPRSKSWTSPNDEVSALMWRAFNFSRKRWLAWDQLLGSNAVSSQFLVRRWQRVEAPELNQGLVSSLDSLAVQEYCPFWLNSEPVLGVDGALVVDLTRILGGLRRHLIDLGVSFVQDSIKGISPHRDGVELVGSSGNSFLAGRAVLCPGSDLGVWFPERGFTKSSGQLALLKPLPEVAIRSVLNGYGSLASVPNRGLWLLGSTYQDSEDDTFLLSSLESRHFVIERLWFKFRKLATFAPDIDIHAFEELVDSLWSGTRSKFRPDGLPIVGEVRSLDSCQSSELAGKLFVLGALASRGLLWGPFLAAHLARAILFDLSEFKLERLAVQRML